MNKIDNDELSLDDLLEQERQKDTAVHQQKLDEDNDTPASPADDVDDSLPEDHQLFDISLDAHEIYDEGSSNAANDLSNDDEHNDAASDK